MDKDVMLIGPYVGSWEYEILSFRPYANWLNNILSEKYDIFLSTHYNRQFLYEFIDNCNFIPIYEDLSRNELKQINITHKDLKIKDFNLLLKFIKFKIKNKNNNKIKNYNLKYTKKVFNCPIYKKVFNKVNVIESNYDDSIVFIPDISDSESTILLIYNFLKSNYNNIIVVGDKKTHLNDKNIILQCIDYFENGYLYILEFITNCKAVITPLSHWTMIANLQDTPVFSWNNDLNIFKSIYNFNNKNVIIPTNDVNLIKKGIDFFLKNLKC